MGFCFPNKGIIFSPDTLPVVGKEVGYKYSGDMQLSLFGEYEDAKKQVLFIAEEFILKNEIPTYINTSNCQNEKFKFFSVFINN